VENIFIDQLKLGKTIQNFQPAVFEQMSDFNEQLVTAQENMQKNINKDLNRRPALMGEIQTHFNPALTQEYKENDLTDLFKHLLTSPEAKPATVKTAPVNQERWQVLMNYLGNVTFQNVTQLKDEVEKRNLFFQNENFEVIENSIQINKEHFPKVIDDMVQKIKAMMPKQMQNLNIDIVQQGLGKISVFMFYNKKQLNIEFYADEKGTETLMQDAIPYLETRLADNHFKDSKITIKTGGRK
jgi:predicted SprT family Zn-dependent metalloprotease